MNKLEISETHSSSIEILKKQIEIRKEQLLQEHANKVNNLILHWVGNIAHFSANILYGYITVKISGTIALTYTHIKLFFENDYDRTLFILIRPFAEDKIREEIRTIKQIIIPFPDNT